MLQAYAADEFGLRVVNTARTRRKAFFQFTLPEEYFRDVLSGSPGSADPDQIVVECVSHPGIALFQHPQASPSVRVFGGKVSMDGLEELNLRLRLKRGEAVPAPYLPPVYHASPGEGLFVLREGTDKIASVLMLEIKTDKILPTFFPLKMVGVSSSPDCDLVHFRGTLNNSQLVADLWVRVRAGSPIAQWELLLTASNPEVPHLVESVQELTMEWDWSADPNTPASSKAIEVPHIIVRRPTFARGWEGTTHAVNLLPADQPWITMGDTQAIEWRGSFVKFSASDEDSGDAYQNAQAEIEGPVYALADVWQDYLPPWRAAGSAPAARRLYLLQRLATNFHPRISDPHSAWHAPHIGLSPDSGRTGDQEDFGSIRGEDLFLQDGPAPIALWELEWAAGREACRPNHQRGSGGGQLNPEAHPNWWQWGCYTHWVSYDKLGKPAGGPSASGGWGGPDREHWSNHRLVMAAALTGSPLLLQLVSDQQLGFLGGETIDARLATSHAGAARGIGRTLASAVGILQLTCDRRLADRMRDRLLKVIGPECRKTGMVRPIHTHGKDGRNLGGLYPFWTPWEHGLSMYGLALAAQTMLEWDRMFPSQGFRDAAQVASNLFHQVGATVVQYGWWQEGGAWVCGKAVAWQGENSPLDPSEYPGPKAESYSGYNLWVLPALVLYGDVLQRANLPVPEKLSSILSQLLPAHGFLLRASPFPGESRWGVIPRVPNLLSPNE